MDIKKAYMSTPWTPRTESVPVPQLAELFDSDGKLEAAKAELSTALSAGEGIADARKNLGDAISAVNKRAVFIVRGLTVEELARVREAKSRQQTILAAVKALENVSGVLNEEFSQLISRAGQVDAEVAARLETIVCGVVEPKIDLELAVHLGKTHAALVYGLADKIFALTDKGSIAGERPASGE